MDQVQAPLAETTGLASFDQALGGILAGDNIVWHVESIEDYRAFVVPYAQAAQRDGRQLIYFRFARHAPLLPTGVAATVHELSPEDGFEAFIHRIHSVIGKAGLGAYYIFDCLSDLAVDWYSDAMLGNFFMLTCPYLFDLKTIAYFGLLRHRHSRHATEPIIETTQLFLDVFRRDAALYVRPIKVQFRYSPTIHLLHAWLPGGRFEAVCSSAVISEVLAAAGPAWAATEVYGEELLRRAEEIVASRGTARYTVEQEAATHSQLMRTMVSRDASMTDLIARYLPLAEMLGIQRRLIGSGLIGGKTVGFLIARRILVQDQPEVAAILEPHDSFYIGSDVFYTFLVRNGVWRLRERQYSRETFLEGADEARERITAGVFPDYIMRQFEEMLDYFGQYPIIVRSSSLLEDNFGNSFAGKYESVFCANQGPRAKRMEEFLAAVKTVYASTMSAEALSYRARHNLLDRDEQMALLVMRVSGVMHGRTFFPHLAGVGFSFNPFAWNRDIDPQAGVVRLVYGLGTRAVDRVDDDYTRVVALNAPARRPESDFEEICRHSQHRVDYIDLDADVLTSGDFLDLVPQATDVPISVFASIDPSVPGRERDAWILTFDRLLSETSFVRDMRTVMQTLQRAYDRPVDIEFAANFLDARAYRINLLQCRPLQVQGTSRADVPRIRVPPADQLLVSRGAVVGHSRLTRVDRFIYVVPAVYGLLPERDRHAVARVIGDLNRLFDARGGVTVAIGPGRWGTSTPALGVPVTFSAINRVSVLCELATMHAHLTPDISLGTHFFNEMVEMNLLYFALVPERAGNLFSEAFFAGQPNLLADLLPGAARWQDAVRVLEPSGGDRVVWLVADSLEQVVQCFWAAPDFAASQARAPSAAS